MRIVRVVAPARQRSGAGTRLVRRIEAETKRRGATVIYLGSDDDFGGTTIHGRNLFPGVLDKLRKIRPPRGHPYVFCNKLGYEIVGVIPDANGYGRPDIELARRIR